MIAEALCESDNTLPKISPRKFKHNTIVYGLNKEVIKQIKYKIKNQELFMKTLKRRNQKKKTISLEKNIYRSSNRKNTKFFLRSYNLNPFSSEDKNKNTISFKTCFGNFFNENKKKKLIEPYSSNKKKNIDLSIISRNKTPNITINENSLTTKDQTRTTSFSINKIIHNKLKENEKSKKIIFQDKSINQFCNLSITPKVNERNKSKIHLMKSTNITINSLNNNLPKYIREYAYNLKKNKKINKSNKKSRNFLAMPSLKSKNSKSINKNNNESETVKSMKVYNNIETINNEKGYLKNISDKNIKNNISNFLVILKINMLFEIKITELMNLKGMKNVSQEAIENIYRSILKLLNDYINILNNSFRDNGIFFFLDKEYNDSIEQIIQFMICLYSFIFIYLTQFGINESFKIFDDDLNQIIKNFSSVLYNYFEKFIFNGLNEREYNLSFRQKLIQLFRKNKYNIKLTSNKVKISQVLTVNLNNCFSELTKKIKKIRFVSLTMYSIFESILILLSQKETNNLQFFINIATNSILYSLLEKNTHLVLNKKFFEINSNLLKPVPPFLPKIDPKYKYTLVLDMDETIMYYISSNIKAQYSLNYGYLIEKFSSGFVNSYLNEKELEFKENKLKDDNKSIENNDMVRTGIFLLRPYSKEFLRELKKYYEIVIFTAGTKEYSDKILNLVESGENLINYRLYRNHMFSNKEGIVCKDLSLLGRDLSKVIIIDNLISNFAKQENNGLPINTWTNDINDTSLKDLIPLLKNIVINKVNDVRNIIKNIKVQFNTENYDYSKIKYNL